MLALALPASTYQPGDKGAVSGTSKQNWGHEVENRRKHLGSDRICNWVTIKEQLYEAKLVYWCAETQVKQLQKLTITCQSTHSADKIIEVRKILPL